MAEPLSRTVISLKEQNSQAPRKIIVEQKLKNNYDLANVREEDHSNVLSAIKAVVTLDDNAPAISVTIGPPKAGYYALVFGSFNGWIDLTKSETHFRESMGPVYGYLKGVNFNPKTGNLVARVAMLKSDNMTFVNVSDSDGLSGGTGAGGRKRHRITRGDEEEF